MVRPSRLVDRLQHRWRRRVALRRLDERVRPGEVLFVCHGNVCRSPFAEAVFRRALGGPGSLVVSTGSAGFVYPGQPCPPDAVAAAAEFGVDLSAHRSRLVSAMSADQARGIRARLPATSLIVLLGDLDPQAIESRTIEDPMNESRDVFRDTYARIDRCVGALTRAVLSPSGPDRGH
jgi:protein-tyrosine-phosphatase